MNTLSSNMHLSPRKYCNIMLYLFPPPLCSSLPAPSHDPVDVYLCRDSNSVMLIFTTQTVTPLLCAAAAIKKKKVQDSSSVCASMELRYDPFVNLMFFLRRLQ